MFLGLDHNWNPSPDAAPILYESMVFGLPDGEEVQERYYTREEATEGHKRLVERYLK